MSEDEKMFQIGLWFLGAVVLLTIVLQVCYRTQRQALKNVSQEIVRTQQEIAVAQANFASFVRPEILRNSVMMVAPKSEIVSFHKSVFIGDLPNRIEKVENENV